MQKSVSFRQRASVAFEREGSTKTSKDLSERRMLRSSRPLGVTQPGAETPQQLHKEVGAQYCHDNTPAMPTRDTPFSCQVNSKFRSHPPAGDSEATPRHPYAIPKEKATPISSKVRPRPLRTPKTATSIGIYSRTTPFRSNIRPPSSITRPSQALPPPSTPSCLCHRDNQLLSLPTGMFQSGGGGALRRVNSSHKQRQQKANPTITEVRVNLQAELEGVVKDDIEGRDHMDVMRDNHKGPTLVTPRVKGRSLYKGAWCKELASLPKYNYYELEAELVNLNTSPVKPDRLACRCSNPLATLLDQHFLISLDSELSKDLP